MKPALELKLPLSEFEALHRLADKGRGDRVKVSRKALLTLLMDHGALHQRIRELGGQTIEPRT